MTDLQQCLENYYIFFVQKFKSDSEIGCMCGKAAFLYALFCNKNIILI